MHIPCLLCSSAIVAPDPYVLGYVQLCFPKQHAENLRIYYSLIVVKIEGMRPRRTNRIMDRRLMWPSGICYFRRDRRASVKLSVFPPH